MRSRPRSARRSARPRCRSCRAPGSTFRASWQLLADGGGPSGPHGSDALARYVEEVYFENPWHDPELSRWSARTAGGSTASSAWSRDPWCCAVASRCGRRRRAIFGSEAAIRAAPRNPLIAMRLVKRFFEGPQDLSVANGANPLVQEDLGRLRRPCGAALQPGLVPPDPPGARASGAGGRTAEPALAARPARAHRRRRPGRGHAGWLAVDRMSRRSATSCRARSQAAVERLARAPGFDLTPRYEPPRSPGSWRGAGQGDRRPLPGDGGRASRRGAISAGSSTTRSASGSARWCSWSRPRAGCEAVLRAAIDDAAAQGLALLRGDVDARDLQAYRDALLPAQHRPLDAGPQPAPGDRRQRSCAADALVQRRSTASAGSGSSAGRRSERRTPRLKGAGPSPAARRGRAITNCAMRATVAKLSISRSSSSATTPKGSSMNTIRSTNIIEFENAGSRSDRRPPMAARRRTVRAGRPAMRLLDSASRHARLVGRRPHGVGSPAPPRLNTSRRATRSTLPLALAGRRSIGRQRAGSM